MKVVNELWVDKYRPSKIDEIILPESVKLQGKGMIEDGEVMNMLLCGGAGTGKTTFAIAFCNEIGADYITYNGSDGSLNIEELRTKIESFALTRSISSDAPKKIILIDEADGLSALIQGALRNAIEKYHKTCRFILTCNYPEKIIGPIHSRCTTIDFKFTKTEQNKLIKEFGFLITKILSKENVEYDISILKEVLLRYYPDNRKILNELQAYSNISGKIDAGMMDVIVENEKVLFDAINSKNFDGVKQWLTDYCSQTIINTLYKNCEKYIEPNNLPLFIICIGEAQQWHSTVPSQELNVLSYLTKYMSEATNE